MKNTLLGIIEGFYGKPYKEEDRLDLCTFLKKQKLDFYLYAPKNASYLRKAWVNNLTNNEINLLTTLSTHCHNLNLKFGFGISPLQICKNYQNLLPLLIKKISYLAKKTQAQIICLLFDDIEIDKNEGKIQNIIIKEVYKNLPSEVERLIVCPSYYSEDPILEKVFGPKPKNYFQDLRADLPDSISFFYTGPQVLAKDITPNNILHAQNFLGANIAIWDNYPVNDGKNICNKIYTKPLSGRRNLNGMVALHALNPMTECHLSKISISSLKATYANLPALQILTLQDTVIKELFKEQYNNIKPYLTILQDYGIQALSDEQRIRLQALLSKIKTPASIELLDFLAGIYKFDEACLTS